MTRALPGLACVLAAGCAGRPAPPPAGVAAPPPARPAAAAVPAGVIPPPPAHARLDTVEISLVTLADSLEPLKRDFNAKAGRMRLLAILSPDCTLCITGIKAIFDEVLLAHPHAEISVQVVWMRAQGGETRESALSSAGFAPTPRVTHFWDPANRAGALVGRSLAGRETLAWDIYLFFEPGKRWEDRFPQPIVWTSQRTNVSGAHLPAGLDMRRELRRQMEVLADYIPE